LGLTLSVCQLQYARQRVQASGTAHQVHFELCDYRDVRGRFDHVVSIEMFEAVGERYWPRFFSRVRELLRPGGGALVQSITIADTLFARYRRGTDFIQRYIFPGGMLPSHEQFVAQAARADFRIADDRAFGEDYARTLAVWLESFDRQIDEVRALGHGPRFERMWRFYLAYCEAGFRAGSTDVHQFQLLQGEP
jgi:cyclopropane-fatty-acyl-phospholipid synthase